MDNFRQKKHRLFALNFREHVKDFIDEHALVAANKKVAISVSGGVDSVALADVLARLYPAAEIIHFNHGTRAGHNQKEEELVRKLADQHRLKINVFHFDLSLETPNFEERAREKRKDIYGRFLKKGYWVYTAHHIDDSFEWTLMQSFKQSELNSTLGIPLFNNGLVRPFMCVTKKQILRYARAQRLFWLEDESNRSDEFERNFMRLHLTQTIYKQYPKALKHYVSSHNDLAKLLGLFHQKKQAELQAKKDSRAGVVFISSDLSFYKHEIKKAIYGFSRKKRGEIDQELTKLLEAHRLMQKNPASFPFKGPVNFSGGVSGYLALDELLILSAKELSFYQAFDELLVNYLSRKTQIPDLVVSSYFPKLVIDPKKALKKSAKFIHPLLPLTCQWLREQGISYAFSPLLGKNDRQLLENAALILDSSVLGL